ncbi:cell wall-active antibiotics response protein LiaF [Peribacillus asahii]|uniref:Cell wall-active antibiotics response protein n=1 Tax=Peribacillus asahii TaxID=228899 RepID=A0A3Q9RS19_9BACI|nr:cell wall-active antibiotics response protein LiaF [Peribacillus asahii]AZV45544.1 cell wall-active antibiotics response protein [Peribacillus asahii]USK85108.1 cell wall-active antibiotics response protein LiaF [Peribacillus asahii]
MFHKMKTDYMSWIFLIGLVLLIVEISFFGGGLLYSLAFSIGCIFVGKKFFKRTLGKIVFILGMIMTVATVLNMMVFRFFLMVLLIYWLRMYYKSKKNPQWMKPAFNEMNEGMTKENLVKVDVLFQNKWFGHQQTPDTVYEWNPVNIQTGFGDTVIDLSQTLLPKGDAVISIRCLVGNMQILVPYGVEVRVHHSVMAGRATIFNQAYEERIFNQIVSYQTEEFTGAKQKVHITTAVIVGDLEVRRV